MARLPQVGGDTGNWGNILNDFLSQAHNANGTIKSGAVSNAAIGSGVISEDKLDSAVAAKLNTVGTVGPQGLQGPAGPAGVVVLDVNDPDPNPVITGVLYIRLTGDLVDLTAPAVPANLAQGTVTSSSIQVTWSASSDNVGVTGYQVRLNGSTVASTTSTSYTFSGLTASTSYSIDVRAGDAAGNWSAWSSTVSVTTPTGSALLFADDFNRADGVAGNGWNNSNGGTVSIISNAMALTGYSGYSRTWQGGLPCNTSVRAVFTGPIDVYQGIFLGFSTTTDSGIKLFNNNGTWVIGNASSYSANNTAVSFVNTPSGSWTSLRLDYDGTTVTAYINNVVVHTASAGSLGFSLDTNSGNVYYAGYCGEITEMGAHARVDSFEVYQG